MKDRLINIYRALLQVETKGVSTKIMAQCLQSLEQLVKNYDQIVALNKAPVPKPVDIQKTTDE